MLVTYDFQIVYRWNSWFSSIVRILMLSICKFSGTYVDPRILPGFSYKVRPINTKQCLFNGRALRLMNIGAGYSKRLTFAPDKGCLNSNSNYFWTDSHPSGFGFELRAVPCGSEFNIYAEDRCVGHASVFRVDNPQYEKTQTVVSIRVH